MHSRIKHISLQRPFFSILLIIALGCVLYSNTFSAPMLFDDISYIAANSNLHHYFDSWSGPVPEGSYFITDMINSMKSRPVVYFTFALNYLAHGLDVTGYHLVNMTIHILAAIALYMLQLSLYDSPFVRRRLPDSNRLKFLPVIVALLFLCHPVQTTAVTYIMQRFTSLATLFYFISVTLYIRARTASSDLKGSILLVTSVVFTITAMFSKEFAFTIPVILILCELFFFEGRLQERIKFLAPLLATLVIIPLNTIYLAGVDKWGKSLLHDATNLANLSDIDRWSYFVTQTRVLITYFRLLLLPINQHLDYDYPFYTSIMELPVLLSLCIHLAIISFGLFTFFKSKQPSPHALRLRLISFGIFWFYITISVSSSIIPLDDLIFEYRLYLPSFGFLLSASIMAYTVWEYAFAHTPLHQRYAVATASMIILALSAATYGRNAVWGDTLEFWQDNVNKSGMKSRPLVQLGTELLARGRHAEAVIQLKKGLSTNSGLSSIELTANINLGLAYARQYKYKKARKAFESAISADPTSVAARGYYAELLELKGKVEESLEQRMIIDKLMQETIVDEKGFHYLMKHGTITNTNIGT